MQCRPTARENHLTQTSFSWLPVPAVQELGYLEITDVNTADDKVIVKGDAGSLSGIGQRYWLIAPAGVDPATGAIETDPCKMGSLWLWAGYHYRAPIVGFHTTPPSQSAGTYGAQTGNNKLGNYYCWNRIYEPATGRWTTPDPAASPWSNLSSYVSSDVLRATDPTGLHIAAKSGNQEDLDYLLALFKRICPELEFEWTDVDPSNDKKSSSHRFLKLTGNGDLNFEGYAPCLENGEYGPWVDAYKGKVGCRVLHELFSADGVYQITFSKNTKGSFEPGKGGGGTINIDQKAGKGKAEGLKGFHGAGWKKGDKGNLTWSRARQLAHEMAHAWRNLKGESCFGDDLKEEVPTVQIENAIAKEIKAHDDAVTASGGVVVGGVESGAPRINTGKHNNVGSDVPDGMPEKYPYD